MPGISPPSLPSPSEGEGKKTLPGSVRYAHVCGYLRKKAKRIPVRTPIWPIQKRNIHWIRLARRSCISTRSLPISPDSSVRNLLVYAGNAPLIPAYLLSLFIQVQTAVRWTRYYGT